MTPFLEQDIKQDEGCRLTAYQDTGGRWTIGYGYAGLDVHEGLVWTQSQADMRFTMSLHAVFAELDADIKWWRIVNDARQDVFVNMAYNLGVVGLLRFDTFLGLAKVGKYMAAADDLEQTLWAKEVEGRAVRLAEQFRTGVRKE